MALFPTNSIMPEVFDFGEPDIDFYPDLEDVESHQLDTSNSGVEVEPYGYDIGFDIDTGRLQLTISGDLRIVNESSSLEQWLATVLTTTAGADLIYSNSFGASLSELVGENIPDAGLQAQIKNRITDAILVHDRIEEVRSFKFDFDTIIDAVIISFVVVTDDAEELVFEGLQLGR